VQTKEQNCLQELYNEKDIKMSIVKLLDYKTFLVCMKVVSVKLARRLKSQSCLFVYKGGLILKVRYIWPAQHLDITCTYIGMSGRG
jgi:hypothetical protein